MQGAIGVPHGEITIVGTWLCGIDDRAIGELGVAAIHIAHLTREERTAVEGAIELMDTCRICIFYIDGVQTVYPLLGGLSHQTLEGVSFCLVGEVVHNTFFRGE